MALKDRFGKPADPEKIQKLIKKYGGSESDVWAISSGNGFVRFDGNTVVLRRTMFGRIDVGKGEKRIPVRHITAVQLKPGLAHRGVHLTIFNGGSSEGC